MKRVHFAASAVIAVVASSALALSGTSAANAIPDSSFFTLSSTTVAAGGTVVVSSVGWGDLSGVTEPMTVINFETPAPPPSAPSGGVGSGGQMGSAGGTSLVLKTIPASAGPWTYTLTIPANTPPGDGYNVCLSYVAQDAIGDGGCLALTVAAVPTVSDVQKYITHVYSDLFNRAPDPAGLATWTSALASGTPRVEVANAITSSTEYRTGLTTGSYQHYLGRGPDPEGLGFWLEKMSSGWTISQMESGFIASDEYYSKAGSTPDGWVTKLYADVLGRTAAPSEVAFWTGQLAGGASRSQVAMGFLLSTERLSTVVDGYYQHLLGRGLDPTGQSTWVGILQAGGRNEAIIGGIIASPEYFARN